jgi:hypothetical protein
MGNANKLAMSLCLPVQNNDGNKYQSRHFWNLFNSFLLSRASESSPTSFSYTIHSKSKRVQIIKIGRFVEVLLLPHFACQVPIQCRC